MKRFFQEHFYLLTAAMQTLVFMSNDAFLPAIPSMTAEFGSTEAKLQQGVAFFVFGSLVLQIFIGPLSDRYGRRPFMLGGALMFLLGSMGCILAQNVQVFLIARIFQGSAMASIIVTSMAAINEYYSRDKALSALALSANIYLLAPMLGPIIGAMILSLPVPQLFSIFQNSSATDMVASAGLSPWRFIFIYIGGLGLVVGIMILLFMPEPSKLSTPSQLTKTSGSAGSRATQHSLLHIFRQIPKILSNRVILLYSISLSLGSFSTLMWITAAPIMLMKNLGLSEQRYAWVQAPVFLCTIVGNSLAPVMTRKRGSMRHMNITHTIILCASPLIFLIAFLWQNSAAALVLAFSMVSLNLGLINAVKNQFIIGLSEYKGSVTSVLMLLGSSGVFLGSLTAPFLGGYPNHYSFGVIAIASFLLGFLGLLANSFVHKN